MLVKLTIDDKIEIVLIVGKNYTVRRKAVKFFGETP